METQSSNKNLKERISSFTLGVVITLAAIYLLMQSGVLSGILKVTPTKITNNSNNYNQPTTWKLPKSTKQGYPEWDTESGKLSILDIEKKSIVDTNINVSYGSGTLDLGETTPKASPNLLYTAYIDKETDGLWILSNETTEKIKVPNADKITYITGWSPSSNMLIYYVQPKTISTEIDQMGSIPDEVEKFIKDPQEGFYSININTGEIVHLTPVENVVGILGDEEILTKVQGNKLAIFDLKYFTVDYATVKDTFGFGFGQIKFSKDGTKWTFIDSNKPTDDMFINKAEFPSKSGTIIDAGGWAEVQWPIISSDGKDVAYQRSEWSEEAKSDIPALWLARGDNAPVKIGMGNPIAWVDENNLLIIQSQLIDGKITQVKALVYIPTKEVTYFKPLKQ